MRLPYPMVLVGGDGGELGLREQEGLEVLVWARLTLQNKTSCDLFLPLRKCRTESVSSVHRAAPIGI